jgi:hypothetical protein
MGVHLTGMHLIKIHFIGMYLIGVYLINIYFIGVYLIFNTSNTSYNLISFKRLLPGKEPYPET